MSTLTFVDRVLRAEKSAQNSTHDQSTYVRTLLARTGVFAVSTMMFSAYIGNVIVREQREHCVEDTVKWSLAMFDVRCISGAYASKTIEQIGATVDDYIEDHISPTDPIELKLAMSSVQHTLDSIFGKQLRITGWMPGFRVAEGKTVLELSGNACPRCTVNPTGYKVTGQHSTSKKARCLNSEDCGWTSF
jgi:hypothetical protein